jgi:poly-gamma-glutamate synthesis protein (capsule biosynthesis protein)
MLGRGIDQILPHPNAPRLYEPYVGDARDYVELAERINGPIPKPVPFGYVWGEALAVLASFAPEAKIVNLETAVTGDGAPWPRKGIHYRLHPENLAALTTAGIDCAVLANNHVLDWGYAGLVDTLVSLGTAGVAVAGAGASADRARVPAVLDVDGRVRILVFGLAHGSSGVPVAWAAREDRAGVYLVPDLSDDTARRVAAHIREQARPQDLVVASIHWGGNWGYGVPDEQRRFAHALIEHGGVDIVHGHSSHHPKGIEVRAGRLILYGCGDLINDYEGISGYEAYRGDLGLMYFPTLERGSGRLLRLEMVAMQMRRLQLRRAPPSDARWLATILDREGVGLGTSVRLDGAGHLRLGW